jgi:hypothetical protein
MKVRLGSGKKKTAEAEILVKEWRRRQNHLTIGVGRILASVSSGARTTNCSIYDVDKGETVGSIQMQVTLRELHEKEAVANPEVTTTALSFSHLYKLDASVDKSLGGYLSRSIQSNVIERLPSSLRLDGDVEEVKSCADQNGSIDLNSRSEELSCADQNGSIDLNSVMPGSKNRIANSHGKRQSVLFREWEGDDHG